MNSTTPIAERVAIAVILLLVVLIAIAMWRLDQRSEQSAQAHEARLAGWVRS